MNRAHHYINQDSGKTDYGTPLWLIEAAREFLGEINLDAATQPYWNRRIRAKRIFHTTRAHRWYQPGLRRSALDVKWDGLETAPVTVWLNPPYGRGVTEKWVRKVVTEYQKGRVSEALVLTFAAEDTSWGQLLCKFPRWKPPKRISHLDRAWEPIKGTTKGSMLTYLGDRLVQFGFHFLEQFGGTVDIPFSEYIL